MIRTIAGLFGVPVTVAVTDPREDRVPFCASETLPRAVAKRQKEFAAGRAAARRAMGRDLPIPQGADRAPVWPEGWRGSIAHADDLCIAVMTRADACIGCDVERHDAVHEDLAATICAEREMQDLPRGDLRRAATLIFCAKEAAFKAQYPLSGALLGFDAFEVTADSAGGTFVARFTRDVSPFAAGHALSGRFLALSEHLVTGVTIGLDDGGPRRAT